MSTYCCEFCGEELNFRMIGGTTVPLHPAGSTCRGKKYYRTENLDRCVLTFCPKCQGEVYFLRHNGGSVWFDSLGRPWPKHGCFNDSEHPLPSQWSEADDATDGMIVQVWLYGLLSGEDGGAFLVSETVVERKPKLKGLRLERLLCPRDFRGKLESLNGKLVLRRNETITTMGGVVLRRDGWYQSSLPWWNTPKGNPR